MRHKHAFLLLIIFMVGCTSNKLPGRYLHPAIAKHPMELVLTTDGTYTWGALYNDARKPMETGKWWEVEGGVVILLPKDIRKQQWFARVDKKNVLTPLRCAANLRELMDESPQPLPAR